MDLVKTADRIIDLDPEGGSKNGGYLGASGSPEKNNRTRKRLFLEISRTGSITILKNAFKCICYTIQTNLPWFIA